MPTIPINLDDETVRRLDTLVMQGLYKNRTEAIRDQIKKGIAQIESVMFPKKSSDYQRMLKKLLGETSSPNIITTTKSAVDLVLEGRER